MEDGHCPDRKFWPACGGNRGAGVVGAGGGGGGRVAKVGCGLNTGWVNGA